MLTCFISKSLNMKHQDFRHIDIDPTTGHTSIPFQKGFRDCQTHDINAFLERYDGVAHHATIVGESGDPEAISKGVSEYIPPPYH